jgi:ubiquinone/menaquinone biosynthesis C-methylase UbiE
MQEICRSSAPTGARSIPADAAYVGTIPEHYHRGIGPFLFEPYARLTAERIRELAPKRILETACGTGIVTRRLVEALAEDAHLVSSDLNEPMLAVARTTVGAAGNVRWVRADMTNLDFPAGTFDAVVCHFGLMFVPDKPAAAREARRVLKRGGRLLLTTWAPLEKNPIVAVAHRAIVELFPGDPPEYLRRAPFGYGDPDVLAELLTGAGFGDVRVDVVEKAAVAPTALDVARGLVEGYPLADEIKARDPRLLTTAVEAAAQAITRQFGAGPVESTIAALVASATA